MSDLVKSNKMTTRERALARALKVSPWLAPLMVALPAPIIFLLLYFITSTPADAVIFFALTLGSLAVGLFIGILVTIFLMLYRRRWERRLRDRLALDGITADELSWFMSELTTAERQALKSIEAQHPALADAYRETLASRLTATRVIASSKRELLLVRQRMNRVSNIKGTDTTGLIKELGEDRQRLEKVNQEGQERRAEALARLQMIEAAASRGASWAETNIALQRLSATREQIPLALESARLEQETREAIQQELNNDAQPSLKE